MKTKDINKVAEILRKARKENEIEERHDLTRSMKGAKYWKARLIEIECLTRDFSEWFKSENPNFDEDKFKESVLK